MTNLFEQYPQGVPVRPSSPVNKQSFSSFVPSPATTQELQRRPKSTKSVWERLTTPLVSEERVRQSEFIPDFLKTPTAFLAKYTTSPLDLALTPLIAFGGPAIAARVARGLAPAIGKRGARIAGGLFDPVGGRALALPGRVLAETGVNVGAGYGAEKGGIVGGLAGGILGGAGSLAAIKGTDKTLGVAGGKLFGLQGSDYYQRQYNAAIRGTAPKKIKEAEKTLKNYIGSDKRQANKKNDGTLYNVRGYDLKSYSIQAAFDAISRSQKDFADSWLAKSGNKIPNQIKKVFKLTGVPWVAKGIGKTYNPMLYADTPAKQAKAALEMHKYRTQTLLQRINNYVNAPLRSGKYWWNSETGFGRIDDNEYLSQSPVQKAQRIPKAKNPNFGLITEGPLATPAARRKMTLAGIENNKEINTNRIYEEYFSTGPGGKKLKNAWDKVLTDDMKEYLERMREVQDFREDLINNVSGIGGRTLDIKKIAEGEEQLIPTGNKEEIDAVIDNVTEGLEQEEKERLRTNLKYAGRISAFNVKDDNLVEWALKGRDAKWYKLGAKTGSERQRQFISMEDALQEGWRYRPHSESALVGIAGIMRRAGELEMAEGVARVVKERNKLGISNVHYLGKTQRKKMPVYDKDGKRKMESLEIQSKSFNDQIKNDPELRDILEEVGGKNGKYKKFDPAITSINQFLDKLEKTAKQKPDRKWRSVKKEVNNLLTLKRFFPELENVLRVGGEEGDALLVRAGTRLEDVISEAKQLLKKNIKVTKKQLEFVVTLQQARRVANLRIPNKAYAPLEYGEPIGTPTPIRGEEGVIDPQGPVTPQTYVTKEGQEITKGQINMPRLYGVDKADPEWYKIVDLFTPVRRGRPGEQQYIAELADMTDPDDITLINKIMSQVIEGGWDSPVKEDIDKAIKILNNQMSILRFGKRGQHKKLGITQEDWRRAAQVINKNGYSQVREQFDQIYGDWINLRELTDADYSKLAKNLIGARDNLVNTRIAYEKRMFDIAKYHVASRDLYREVNSPLFSAQKFAVEDATQIKELEDFKVEMDGIMQQWKPNDLLRGIEQINRIQRLNALAFDGSIFMIQFLPIMFNHPKIIPGAAKVFAKTVVNGIRDPQAVREWRASYLSQDENVEILKKSNMIMSTDPRTGQRTLESIEALNKSGVLERLFDIVPGYSKLSGAFGDGIAATMDFAGLELRKGLDPLAKNAKDGAGLDAYVNSMRGLASSQASGVGFKQRTLESALLLAPRYRRAMFSLYTMALQGGVEGYLARKAIVNLTAGVAMTALALQGMMSAMDGDSEDEAAEKLERMMDPTKGDFMLFDIFNQKVGPGSKIISDAKILTKAIGYTIKQGTGDDIKDWENFMKFDRDNPALKWVRAQAAAAPSEAIDIALGSNFIGEPAFMHGESIGDNAFIAARSIRENIMPLWIESAFWSEGNEGLNWEEDAKGRLTRGGSEFFGFRSWPQGPGSILRQESFETMGESYDSLEPHERALLSYKLTERLNPLQQKQAERGTSDFALYFNRKKQIEEEFTNGLMELMMRYPNTKEGNRDMYFAYRQLKGFKRGREYQEMQDIEWEEHDQEDKDPIKKALAQTYALYDDPEIDIAPGVVDWDVWEMKNDALLKSFTPEQRTAVKRNQRKDPIPGPFLLRLQEVAKKEYKSIMESQSLRERHLTNKGREDLATESRNRFLMLDMLTNLDNQQQ